MMMMMMMLCVWVLMCACMCVFKVLPLVKMLWHGWLPTTNSLVGASREERTALPEECDKQPKVQLLHLPSWSEFHKFFLCGSLFHITLARSLLSTHSAALHAIDLCNDPCAMCTIWNIWHLTSQKSRTFLIKFIAKWFWMMALWLLQIT